MEGSTPTAPRPSIGRIVHFFPGLEDPDQFPQPRAAMIVGVKGAAGESAEAAKISSPSHVHLVVFDYDELAVGGSPIVLTDIPAGVGTKAVADEPSCWRWPERV